MKYPNPSSYTKHIKTKVDKTLGYVYFLDKEHPLASKGGKIYYHRHVASVAKGKWIDGSYCVHHIDGNKQNNDPSNLQVISYRMHTRLHNVKGSLKKECPACGKKFFKSTRVDSKYCSKECVPDTRKVLSQVTKEELEKLVWEISTVKLAKKLNCSDVAIAKACKKLGIKKPPRGYWAKQYAKNNQ